jgi:hypothetical protein
MLSLVPENDVPDPTLPTAFEGRASTQLSTLTVDQARRYLKVQIKAFYAALAVVGVVVCAFLSFIAWPLFLIALLFSWFCYSVIGAWWEAHKKSQAEIIKRGPCPHCGTSLYIWAKALNCPVCTRRLIDGGNRLYDMT